MANLEGQTTVCEKCGFAIWIRRKTRQTIDCGLFRDCRVQSFHPPDYHFLLDCNSCGNELDKTNQESGKFCSQNSNILQWQIPSGDGVSWTRYVAIHLVCLRCKKEDRNIRHNYGQAYHNSNAPEWYSVSYYGITSWGKLGGGPWMEELVFCHDCHIKTDTEEWLKQTMGLVLIREGNPNPHKISQLAKEMEKNYPHIKLEPYPWG